MRGDFLDGEKRTLTLQIPTVMQCTEGHLQHPSTMHNRQPVQYERLPAPSSRAASGQADTPRIGTRNCPCPRGSTPHYRAAGPGVVLVWKFECARVCFLALGRFSHGGDKLRETPLGPSKARSAWVIGWV